MSCARTEVLVVSGLSGAGKTTAIDAIEDQGYYCVDNLPPQVISNTLQACVDGEMCQIAFGLDVRTRVFLDGVGEFLDDLASRDDVELKVLFLDASDSALLNRFRSTRRPHPLSAAESSRHPNAPALAVMDGIRLERERLAPLRARARLVIDTTDLSVHDLRRAVLDWLSPDGGGEGRMRTRFVSFGFKYGAPMDADLMLDVRFLPNPYFVPELRPFTGQDGPVRDFVLSSKVTEQYLDRALALLEFCLPRFATEGKSYLTVAIGCTGGRHRSVAIADWLASRLVKQSERSLDVMHRDIGRANSLRAPRGDGPEEAGSLGLPGVER